jgi:DDE superfamily endonuclease
VAADAQLGHASRQRLCPKRTAVVSHYTEPPAGSTTVCTDELGPVVPRTFPPAAGWSADGHRIKAPLDYERGPEKTWVYGALRVRDGKVLTRCAASRNSKGYIASLTDIAADNPTGDIYIITDNLSSHYSLETRTWLEEHPRIHHVFIPTGACWLNLQEGWWRLFRRDALAGQSFANPMEIAQATRVATAQLNLRAKPWVWGRPPKTPRYRRRLFSYRL